MKRRQFIEAQLKSTLWLAAGVSGLFRPADLFAATPDIGVAHGGPGPATRAAVELMGGMKAFVKKGDRVVIKPNISFADPPEAATTTHPDVVTTLVSMCFEAGAENVTVQDNPLRASEMCLERSGIKAACEAIKPGIVHGLEGPEFYTEADIPDGRDMKRNRFLKEALRADVLIAAPVAKSHGGAGVSLSLKGMMGLILDRGVMHARYDLHQAIVDLNTKLPADLTVIDATRVLTTNGPYGPGKVDKKNMVVASRDQVAADSYTVSACEWWGRKLKPANVKHIKLAAQQGLGRIDIENLNIAEVNV